MPLLPNLLPWLATLDPTKPTYFGNPHLHPEYHMYYFEGMLYGFSWGVVSDHSESFARAPTDPSCPGEDTLHGRRVSGGSRVVHPRGRSHGRANSEHFAPAGMIAVIQTTPN